MSFGERFGIAVVGGVAAGVVSNANSYQAVSLAAGAAVLSVACRGAWPRWCGAWAWIGITALAVAHGARTRDVALEVNVGHALHVADADTQLIEGTLRRDASPGDSGVRLELETSDGRVLVNVGGVLASSEISAWTAGRGIRASAQLRVPPLIRNPGSNSERWQRLTQPFDLVGTVKSAALVEVGPAPAWQEGAAFVRRHVRSVADRWLKPLSSQTSAVVTAVLIGDRAGLDPLVMRRLQVAGTFHVIAISGGNVAVLTALGLFVLQLVCRGERLPVFLTLIGVVAYGGVVGNDPSVMRAVVAAVFYLSLRLLGLVPSATNVLALTGACCALVDPLVVVNVGAWLSFGATFGLLTVLPRLMPRDVADRSRVWLMARGLFLATAAAEIIILPVSASIFMRVGLAGLLLNFVAIPAMVVVQLSGLLLCAVWWWPAVASAVAAVAHGATSALVMSASAVDLAPWLSWRLPPPPLSLSVLYYACVALAMTWSGRRLVSRAAVGAAMCAAMVMVTAPWMVWHRPASGWLRVTVVDVGQGEAVVAQFPQGQVLLVDAGGSAGAFDVGGRVVTPALRSLGIRRLDWLALTHGDIDHVGGAGRVIEELAPRDAWEGVPVPLHPPLIDVRRAAQTRGVGWRRLQAGDQLELGSVQVDVFHPPAPDWERPRVRNDDSLVIRLRFGQVEVLLTGDVESEFESAYVPTYPRPPIRLLKVAHHGSKTSSSERFLDAYAPAAAVVSVGQGNSFGHPSPMVLERLQRRRIDVFRTDQDGATIIETDGRDAYVQSWTGRMLMVTTDVSRAATPPPFPR